MNLPKEADGKWNLPRYLGFAGCPAKPRYRPKTTVYSTIYGEIIENDKDKTSTATGGLHNRVNIKIGNIYKNPDADRIRLEISSFLEYSINVYKSFPAHAFYRWNASMGAAPAAGPSKLGGIVGCIIISYCGSEPNLS